jgi:TPR repeat protein
MRYLFFGTVVSLTLIMGNLFGDDATIPALQAAVAKGDPVAEQELGRAYQLGEGVPINFTKALDLYRQSAAQGNAKAMNNLGYMYHFGKGVPVDDAAAAKWLLQAADKDLASAELALGLAYYQGDMGFSRDPKTAEMWLTKASSHAEEPKQVAPAANALGALYEGGIEGGKPDYDQAIRWYEKAADLNFAKAETNLGMLYHVDVSGRKDLVAAYMWFRLAAEQNEPGALHALSNILDGHELTDAQMAEGDKRAKEFLAAHNLTKPLGAPKHIVTPETLMLRDALEKQAQQQNGASTNAVPAVAPVAGTGTK